MTLLHQRLLFSSSFAIIRQMPFYAVRKGRNIGIFKTWDECQKQVHQFQGAQFKKFKTEDEANNFIGSVPKPPTTSWSRKTYRQSTKRSTVPLESDALTSYKKSKVQHSYGGSDSSVESVEKPTVVYTDGSCTKNGMAGARAGVGVYWGPDHPWNVSEKLYGPPTNQRAELTAALRAIEVAKKNDLEYIELKTDSIYTIKCATEWIDRWKENGWRTSKNGNVLNKDLIQELDEARMDITVKWKYVPGHKGIHGNEEADRLANIGAKKQK
ncbi:ribonuclease H1-like [Antedon mediterranea]|uniref:ribonuclease H1-like n=1 Tax=Antedon mediterranea TaxID=105859 RepID=UPI003AF6F1EF